MRSFHLMETDHSLNIVCLWGRRDGLEGSGMVGGSGGRVMFVLFRYMCFFHGTLNGDKRKVVDFWEKPLVGNKISSQNPISVKCVNKIKKSIFCVIL